MTDDLKRGYLFGDEAAKYLRCGKRKVALFRKYGLLKSCKYGKNYVYKVSWLDEFSEEWAGTDLSNEAKIRLAINSRAWREKHS